MWQRCTLLFATVAVVCVGCVTGRPDLSQYVRDGVQYGKVDPFRGRWWNYYARGCSFLEGEFWQEAEQDLRTALMSRGKDQLWPRTYGLHFFREYFPHRELGIVLYRQARLDEATAELELSLEQQYSARAAYYLNEARAALITSRALDTAAPTVEILSPASSSAVGQIDTELVGIARDDTFVASITINREPHLVDVSAKEIPFSHPITLRPGENEIHVAVTDLAGKTTTTLVRIESDVDGPAVSFDTPVVVPGVVTGAAYDPAGVVSLAVAGKPASLSSLVNGSVSFSVTLARDELEPPLLYNCEDTYGNITQGQLPLDMLVLSAGPSGPTFASAATRVIAVGQNLNALILGHRLVSLALAASDSDAPRLSWDLRTGQQYFREEIVVSVSANAISPLRAVTLNDVPFTSVPGRTNGCFSRRVKLSVGENAFKAVAEDADGRVKSEEAVVERQLTEIEKLNRKLSVAFVDYVSEGTTPIPEGEGEFILNSLPGDLAQYERFTVVDRRLLRDVLAEHTLSAELGSREARLFLCEVIPAEVMFIARLRRDTVSLEIVLEGTSTETTEIVAPRVDVAGPYEHLERLVQDLALRLVQKFPRVQAKVLDWEEPEVTCKLTEADRVRESMKCVVFRYGKDIVDPDTGKSLGRKTKVLSEGLIRSVDKNFSIVEVIPQEGETVKPIEVGDYVVTK